MLWRSWYSPVVFRIDLNSCLVWICVHPGWLVRKVVLPQWSAAKMCSLSGDYCALFFLNAGKWLVVKDCESIPMLEKEHSSNFSLERSSQARRLLLVYFWFDIVCSLFKLFIAQNFKFGAWVNCQKVSHQNTILTICPS